MGQHSRRTHKHKLFMILNLGVSLSDDVGNISSVIEKIKRSMGRIEDEERKVHPDCRNAPNPYHECSEYCFMIIADAKKRINKNDTGSFFY